MIAVYFYVRLRNTLFDIILLFLLIAAAIIFILFPELTNKLAHYLGVGRGVDLIFYISTITFWFVILKLYTRIRKLEQIMTTIIRKDALENKQSDQ
jgi:hypothetical protein